MPIATTEGLAGRRTVAALGLVLGLAVRSSSTILTVSGLLRSMAKRPRPRLQGTPDACARS